MGAVNKSSPKCTSSNPKCVTSTRPAAAMPECVLFKEGRGSALEQASWEKEYTEQGMRVTRPGERLHYATDRLDSRRSSTLNT